MSFGGNAWFQQAIVLIPGGSVHEFTGTEAVSFDGAISLNQIAQFVEVGQAISFDGSVAIGAIEEFSGSALTNFDGSLAGMQQIAQFAAARAVTFDGLALLGFAVAFSGNEEVSFNGNIVLSAFQWEDSDSPANTIWVDVD